MNTSDVKVRDKKTKEIKELPIRVAKILKNVYEILGPADMDTQTKPFIPDGDHQIKPLKQIISPEEPVITSEKKSGDVVVNESEDQKTELRTKYEELYGRKPGGRMSTESLQKAITEKEHAN